ncbi:MAG: hypothetical protein ACI8P0_005008, partial [Planctomycetaceae bacterium]
MILLNWLNALRYRLRQRRRKQQLPGSRSGLASTPGRSKRPSRLTPAQIELLEERVLLSAVTVSTTNDVLDGDTSSITNLMATPGADGFISLREAVVAANNGAGADSISIPTGTYTLSLSGASEDAGATGDLDITDELSITGAGAGNTTVSGGGIDRVFHILADNVSIADLTVTGGDQSQGGGLRIENTAALDRIVVTGNVSGGGIFMRNNAATLTINDSTISNNASDNGGGLLLFEATTTITNSTISGNTSTGNAGGIFARGGLNLLNSTVSGNVAAGVGGGINHFGTSSIINSTITGNIADSDNNDATDGGGIKIGNVNQLTLQNSIVAGNFVDGSSTANDLSGSISFLTNPINNLIGDAGSSAGITDGTNGNIVGNSGTGTRDINTVLNTTLADSGGTTLTHALVSGSVAIDAGDNTTATNAGITTDQRGTGFARIANTTVDMGAFELALFDFGDGPILTSAAVDGARHAATGPTLGATRDVENDGLESASADTDDLNGTDDEDGVTFGAITVGQQNATVTVNVQGAVGKLDAWIDFNGDGSFNGVGEQIFDSVSVLTGDNNLTFDVPAEAISGNTIARFRLSTLGGLAPTGLAADGEVEDYQVSLTAPAGSGTFVQSASLGSLLVQGTAAADFNGDGNQDVIFTHNGSTYSLFLGNGDGTFGAEMNFALAGSSRDIVAADIDGDGDIDFFTGNVSSGSQVFFNDGAATPAFTEAATTSGVAGTYNVELVDIDGDGDLDLYHGDGGGLVNRNNGNGTFATQENLSTLTARAAAFGDLDGDGDLDLFGAPGGANPNNVYFNDGTGSFTDSSQSLGSSATKSIALADLDGDGDLDAFIANDGQADKVFLNNGSGTFTDSGQSLDAGRGQFVRLADIDGDGDFDAIVGRYTSTSLVMENNGSGTFTQIATLTASFAQRGDVADFNNDGSIDVVLGTRTGGSKIFLNTIFETEVTLDGSNNLVITDINGGTSIDNLTITADGTNLTITDNNGLLIDLVGPTLNGGTGDGTATVTVPLSAFTGTLSINTLAGDDTVVLNDLTLLSNQSLNIETGDGNDTVTFETAATTLSGTGGINVTAETVNVNAALSTPGSDLLIAADNLAITATINVGTNFAEIFESTPDTTIGIGAGAGTLSLTDAELDLITAGGIDIGFTSSGTISVGGTVSHAGDAHILVETGQNIVFESGSSWTTTDGSLTFEANLSGTSGSSAVGIDVNAALIQATGTGAITVLGHGGDSGSGRHGVLVRGGADIIGGTTGSLTVTGTGGNSLNGSGNDGVFVTDAGSSITSGGGAVSVIGFGGGTGDSSSNVGVAVVSGGVITAGGTGSVNVTGQGGNTTGTTGGSA